MFKNIALSALLSSTKAFATEQEISALLPSVDNTKFEKYVSYMKDLEHKRDNDELGTSSDAFKTMIEICNENGFKAS